MKIGSRNYQATEEGAQLKSARSARTLDLQTVSLESCGWSNYGDTSMTWKVTLKYELARARNRRAIPIFNKPTKYALGKEIVPLLTKLGLVKRAGIWSCESVSSEEASAKLSQLLEILGCPSANRTGYLKYLNLTIEPSAN